MFVNVSPSSQLLIVRLTRGGKISFHTGVSKYERVSDSWTTELNRAQRYVNDKSLALLVNDIHRGETDQVMVMPEEMIHGLVKWNHDTQAQLRKQHRLNRLRPVHTATVKTAGPSTQPRALL